MLGSYCQQPEHRYATRYATSNNYVLPPITTDRGKGSIKFSGPKAWAEVPNHLKDIAFRKPFTKQMKTFILKDIFVELPPESNSFLSVDEIVDNQLEKLFQEEEIDSEFFGFIFFDQELNDLFETDDEMEDYEFRGF